MLTSLTGRALCHVGQLFTMIRAPILKSRAMKLPVLSLVLVAVVIITTVVVVMSDAVTLQPSEYGVGRMAARHLLDLTW